MQQRPPLRFLPSGHPGWAAAARGDDRLWAWGWAETDGRVRAGRDLAEHLLDRLCAGVDPNALLGGLKGNFATAWQVGGLAQLAADQVRSRTLVWRMEDGTVLASDDVWRVAPQGGPLDPDSAAEFATAGFVTGPHTIFPGISALQAGERVAFEAKGPRSSRYYQYLCSYDGDDDLAELCRRQDDAVMAAMARSVASVGGRQIVVPLSAGLDSRLVAAGLKRLGYDNVLCIAYGLPGSHEAEGSRWAAGELGLPWEMVPYDPARIRSMLQSREGREFWRMCTAGVSMPFMTDYPALVALREAGRIEPDAVFMPGQSGDFIVGSHLKYVFDPAFNADPLDVRAAVIAKHYLLWEDLLLRPRVRQAVDRRMDEILVPLAGGGPASDPVAAARAYECWEWQERQCKHVVNEGRCFEFFGHEWRMPLWDVDIMEYWRPARLEHKVTAFLYREYLATVNPGGVFAHERLDAPWDPARTRRSAGPKGRRLRRLPLLGRLLQWRERYRRHKKTFQYYPTGFAQSYGYFRYVFREPDKRNDNSLLLKDFLAEVYGLHIERL